MLLGYRLLETWGYGGFPEIIRPGITIHKSHGRFIVRTSGLYYFNSRLLYNRPTNSAPPKMINFSQKLIRWNQRYPDNGLELMVEDTHTVICQLPRWVFICHTSAISVLLQLRYGDELYIEANHWQDLVTDRSQHQHCYVDLFNIGHT